VGGARRWIVLGPVGLQAGEAMKLAIVAFLAATLAGPASDLNAGGSRFRATRYFAVPAAAAALLLCEPDFGTAVLILVVAGILVFAAGARLGTLAGVLALAVPLGLVAISTSAYRMRRVLAFLDPWSHRHDIGYQITESLMTLGSGGVVGLGLGASRQKLFFLPAAHTDFVFAVIGEELGFVGVALVVACFAVIGWRAVRAASRARTAFTSLLILGLSSMVLIQAIFNTAVVLGLVPTKGITLPFVSYGGSSLVMSLLAAGVLLRACAECEREPAVAQSPRRSPMKIGLARAGDA
jgi:cell division protein FtsW